MKTIRLSLESNSSSSHSICLSDVINLQKSALPIKNGTIRIRCGEFGWEYAKYRDAGSKASYLATYLMQARDKDLKARFIYAIKLFTGAKDVLILSVSEKDITDFGYIDHQSVDCAYEVLSAGRETILNFVFNPDSILITDNDNH